MDILKSLIVWLVGIFYLVILFPFTFLIWLLVFPFDRERIVVHMLLCYQSLVFTKIVPAWTGKIEGRNKAAKGATYVIISNHQSLLDTLFINSLRYRYKWISKIENNRVPVLGWYLQMAGYITIDRGNEDSKIQMLDKSYRCLQRGISIMIFPEGTRSRDNEIGFFKRGAFQLAILAKVPLLPIVIDGTGGILPKHGLIFGTGHHVNLRVLDPVLPESFGTDNPDELALRLSSIMKETLSEMRTRSETR
jgi:1-acyl-sn-glycerol-3-phosphate acyltransferase